MGELELRHASVLGNERFALDTIHDKQMALQRQRLQMAVRHHLPIGLSAQLDVDYTSDRYYLADYVPKLASTRYLTSRASLSQAGNYGKLEESWSLITQYQQDLLVASNAATLQQLPRLESHMLWRFSDGLIAHLDQQSTRFSRQQGLDGWRMALHPYLILPWQLDGGGASAKMILGSHYTHYWLQPPLAVGTPATAALASAELAVEVRTEFEKIYSGKRWRHLLVPMLRYDLIQAPNQQQLPNFDSGYTGLTWSNLMTGNHFSGYDRVGRANRLSLLLENHWQHKNSTKSLARDILVLRAGMAYHFKRSRVDPLLQGLIQTPFSNALAEVVFTPWSGVQLSSSGQYQLVNRYWASLTSTLQLSSASGNALRVSQTLTDRRYAAAVRLLSGDVTLKPTVRWRFYAGGQYDALLKRSQQLRLGVKYIHPCWSLGVEGYRLNLPVRAGQPTSSFGVRILLEFKGLGSVGS